MRSQLESRYYALMRYFDICDEVSEKNVNRIIKNALLQFTGNCKNPAIWCYGKHTRMLMTDFIFEMKDVKFIIDETHKGEDESGFKIISQNQIRENRIDGVIISSFKYKEEIKKIITERYNYLKYLDIYDILQQNGVILSNEYFEMNHPYGHYLLINEYRRKLKYDIPEMDRRVISINLLKEYIKIKDLRSAVLCTEKYGMKSYIEPKIVDDIQMLYELQQIAVSKISDKNVVMICIDGLRRQDIMSGQMKKINHLLEESAYIFQNAYSVSTSTYESLIPAYSENMDLRTKYFEKNIINEKQCRFIQMAIEQKRKIHFYTDATSYIDSNEIEITDRAQTATEKIWDFILDAMDEDNGLFYIHILYESHYSYPNPYTEGNIVADGSNIMFDFLAKNGGRMRTDYDMQHRNAISYIDDVLYPILSKLKARFVLYADHGNIILPKDTRLDNVSYAQGTFDGNLIQIPLIIKSPEMGIGINEDYTSLLEINNIIISLLKKEKYIQDKKNFIKIVRSQIYNPDFQYLYKKMGYERGLMAFEGYIFDIGYKLIIYSDGVSELYKNVDDLIINDNTLKKQLVNMVRDFVTVTDKLLLEE